MAKSSPYPGSLNDFGGGVDVSEGVGFQPLDNDLTTLAGGAIPANLKTSLDGEYAPLASPTFSGNVVIPAGNAATEAAQITAYAAGTGRISIAGVEMGSTGWRSCAATDLGSPANVTTSVTRWRRVGGVVQVYFASFTTGASWADTDGADNNLVIPAGFRPERGGTVGVARNSVTGLQSYVFTDGAVPSTLLRVGRVNMAASQGIQATVVSWPTDDAWPASLPGTQVTAPPTP